MDGTFGARLRRAMERRGWSQKALAAEAGLDQGAVSRHLRQEHPPKPQTVEKYRLALEVSAEWLAYGRGPMVPAESSAPRALEAPTSGPEALEYVLRDYVWPAEMDIATMDAICAEARREALTPAGEVRPASIWRVLLDQLVARHAPKRQPDRPCAAGA